MAERKSARNGYDVVGIGNAIVDIIARCDDAFLSKHDLAKGFMRLIPAGEAILLSLLESILAPIWVWAWPGLHEYPGDRALIGGALVIAAVIWNTMSEMANIKRVAPPIE